MTSLTALTVINPQAIPFVVFVAAFLRFLTTDPQATNVPFRFPFQ